MRCFSSGQSAARLTCIVLSTLLLLPVLCAQQPTPQRDPSAITFLSRAVSSVGGGAALASIEDFSASGTITHFWNNSSEQGQLTVKSRGPDQFRLDSQVASGTWSLIANHCTGEIIVPDGRKTRLPCHNLMTMGSLTWPILKINTALQDSTMTIMDMGLAAAGSAQTRQIRVLQSIQTDPTGLSSKLTTADYFFDPTTFALVQVQDVEHPDNAANNNPVTRTIAFGNYQTMNGMLVPFSVSEKIAGQQIWQIQLSSIAFNAGLSDSDFEF